MPDLTTKRLLLRDFTASDTQGVHAYASDPEVCRYMDWGPNTLAQTQAFIDDMVAAAGSQRREPLTWAVTAAGVVLGACSVTVSSVKHRRGVMGYVLAREHWGQGYGTEAAAAALRFAHDQLDLKRVEATCRPANAASQGVLRRIGMQQEGLLRSHMLIRGRREDSLLFSSVSRVRGSPSSRHVRTSRLGTPTVGPAPLSATTAGGRGTSCGPASRE